MFRFSIRELMVLTLAALVGVAWYADHRRWLLASEAAAKAHEDCKLANDKAGELERENRRLDRYIDGINEQLQLKHKLQLVWHSGGGRESFVAVSPRPSPP